MSCVLSWDLLHNVSSGREGGKNKKEGMNKREGWMRGRDG